MDANFEHTYCRNYLRLVMADVKKQVPLEVRKAAWTYSYGRCKEFQINKVGNNPSFYWHGRACCCWEARAKGWTAYLEQIVKDPKQGHSDTLGTEFAQHRK